MAAVSERPTILVAAYGLIPGGGETFPIFLANELRKRGWPVAFVDYGRDKSEPGIRELLKPHVPLYRLRDEAHLGHLCRHLAVDIVHTSHVMIDQSVARHLRLIPDADRPKHVVTLHGGYETCSLPDLLDILPLFHRIDHFVYTASKNLDNFPGRLLENRPFTRIPNALPPTNSVSRERLQLGIGDDAVIAMLIARGIPGKGWEVARAAVELVREQSKQDVHLVIIGDGPAYDLMTQGQVPEWLHLLDFQADIRSWIPLADVALLPSTFSGESFPLVLIDFLTLGVPAIASSIGEIPDMLNSDLGIAGYLIEIADGQIPKKELVEKIMEFVELNSSERDLLRDRARHAAAKFDFQAMVDAYEDVYRSLTQVVSLEPMAEPAHS